MRVASARCVSWSPRSRSKCPAPRGLRAEMATMKKTGIELSARPPLCLIAASVLSIFSMMSGIAYAGPVPLAIYSVSLSSEAAHEEPSLSGTTPIPCFSVPTQAVCAGVPTTDSAEASATSGPITVSASGGGLTSAQAGIEYFFRIDGPANKLVSFNLSGSGATSLSSGDSTLDGSVDLFSFGNGNINDIVSDTNLALMCESQLPGACGTVASSFILDQELAIESNTVMAIDLNVIGEDGGTAGGYGGSIDPVITIDPLFVAEGFTLELSPNVSQISASSVPEPASIALLAAGLAGLGAMRRKRTNAIIA